MLSERNILNIAQNSRKITAFSPIPVLDSHSSIQKCISCPVRGQYKRNINIKKNEDEDFKFVFSQMMLVITDALACYFMRLTFSKFQVFPIKQR